MTAVKLISVLAFGVFAAFLTVWLKQIKPEFSVLLSIASAVVILIFAVNEMAPIFSFIGTVKSAVSDENGFGIIIKIMAISFIVEFAAESCVSAGEQAIASKVELCGKVAIVLTALPLFKNVLELIVKVTR